MIEIPPSKRIGPEMLRPLGADNQITCLLSSSDLIRSIVCLPGKRQPCLAPPSKQRRPSWLTGDLRTLINYPILLRQCPEMTGTTWRSASGMHGKTIDVLRSHCRDYGISIVDRVPAFLTGAHSFDLSPEKNNVILDSFSLLVQKNCLIKKQSQQNQP